MNGENNRTMVRIEPGRLALLALLLVAVMPFFLSGCASEPETLSADKLEEKAQSIDKSLMCPVCPSETIDQSQVEIAKQMRVIVREKLAQGESREQILQFFVDRYGPGILAEPPKSGFNLLVWVIPPVVLLLSGGMLVVIIRAMRRGQSGQTNVETPQATSELDPYLSSVDEEIRRLGGGDVVRPSRTQTEGSDNDVAKERAE